TEVASTDVAVQFKQGELSGSSVGAQLQAKTHYLALAKDAHVVSTNPDPKKKDSLPVEIHSDRASYVETEGVMHFEGNANVTQGAKLAHADAVTGVVDVKNKKLLRIEMRSNSVLKSQEKGKSSEMQARDMDFFFDEMQHLKQAVATGSAHAVSLEKDS